MDRQPSDQPARDRFARVWDVNFAVVANAGSGKTTAISRRLVEMALRPEGAPLLQATAVVAYTKKAARQIGQRARAELMRRMEEGGRRDPAALARLDTVFFGTIHSFCILLARRHGSSLGVHLNPALVDPEDEDPVWEAFIDQDAMEFESVPPETFAAFLRHASIDAVFGLARDLGADDARRLRRTPVDDAPPGPPAGALEAILGAASPRVSAALARNQQAAREWLRRFREERGPLPIARPEGTAAGIVALYRDFYAPLKGWLARVGGTLAAELSLRYRLWRQLQGIQTYDDQVDTALSVLRDARMIEEVRREGWRIILDEAQDADAGQLSVLIEIARPPGADRGAWPGPGLPPRPGHFCMVGDAQQGIYSTRAEIRRFADHVAALSRAGAGECLRFDVTFRAPQRVVDLLNRTLPEAFGPARPCNLGVPPSEGAPAPLLQVDYEPLVAGPRNAEGGVWRLPVSAPESSPGRKKVDAKLAHEAREVAALLVRGGPASVGARNWGDLCILAPRRAWLAVIHEAFDRAGLPTSLQVRRQRSADNPAYAWLCGLLCVICDPENMFEWSGVLREVFGVSDALIASALREGPLRWDEPDDYPEPLRAAFETLRPFILRADNEGEPLGAFAAELSEACLLAGRARLAGPEGAAQDELDRLLGRAAALGAEGAGPREWLRDLQQSAESLRASGKPDSDAINLLTSHSAKGLEWGVVVVMGLWRTISSKPEHGMRLLGGHGAVPRVVFDNEGVDADAAASRERGLSREHIRLLYVTLTRPRQALVIPCCEGEKGAPNSFASLWGLDPASLEVLPPFTATGDAGVLESVSGREPAPVLTLRGGVRAPAFPKRVLPHQLAGQRDNGRSGRHEASLDEPLPSKEGTDPLDYGVWWHEMLEFIPWTADEDAVKASAETSIARARELGFEARARHEWGRLLASEPWRQMRESRWKRLAEVGVFAPLGVGAWIDGVIDLVLHDPASGEVRIVDWKTNRRREGEDDRGLLSRLVEEYRPQLEAYGSCAAGFFPGSAPSLWVYSTVAGQWARIEPLE